MHDACINYRILVCIMVTHHLVPSLRDVDWPNSRNSRSVVVYLGNHSLNPWRLGPSKISWKVLISLLPFQLPRVILKFIGAPTKVNEYFF
jgi:hypothetical protein